jgi:transcriptional regulator with XRE-family HTH domain
MPRPTSRKKSDLSIAVCELRSLLGDSQQSFSNRLGLALNTIARYETTRPPSGDVLLLLAEVAEQYGHFPSSDLFRTHYVEELFDKLKVRLLVAPETPGGRVRGYLMQKLHGKRELVNAENFLTVLDATQSEDPDVIRRALDGFSALEKVARECDPSRFLDREVTRKRESHLVGKRLEIHNGIRVWAPPKPTGERKE